MGRPSLSGRRGDGKSPSTRVRMPVAMDEELRRLFQDPLPERSRNSSARPSKPVRPGGGPGRRSGRRTGWGSKRGGRMSKKVKRTPLSPAARAYLKAKREVWERTSRARSAREGASDPGRGDVARRRSASTRPCRWAFDRAWPDLKVAIEIDGGTFSRGAHVRGKGIENDHEKTAEAIVPRLARLPGDVGPGQERPGDRVALEAPRPPAGSGSKPGPERAPDPRPGDRKVPEAREATRKG